jgi:hypothetical protein
MRCQSGLLTVHLSVRRFAVKTLNDLENLFRDHLPAKTHWQRPEGTQPE